MNRVSENNTAIRLSNYNFNRKLRRRVWVFGILLVAMGIVEYFDHLLRA